MLESAAMRQHTQRGTAFVTAGAGLDMLLIHGVGMNADAMAPLMHQFARTHRVHAIDMLGHGETLLRSDRPELAEYIRQASDFLEDVTAGPACVIGHSMGALVAIGLVLAQPRLCSALVALNAVHCRDNAASRAVRARAEEIARSDGPGDVEAPLRRWFGDTAEHDLLKIQLRRWLAHVPHAGYAAAYRVFAAADRTHEGRLGALAVPALFLTGALDRNSTPAMSRQMAAEAPRGAAVVLPDCGHVAHLTHPGEVNKTIGNWIREAIP